MLVVPEDHPMATTDRPLALEDLAEMELLLPLPGTSFRDELDRLTRPLGITLQPAAEIDGLRLIASLAFEGYGPAILPATAIPGFLAHRFRPVPVEASPAAGSGSPSAAAACRRHQPGPLRRAAQAGGGASRGTTGRARRRRMSRAGVGWSSPGGRGEFLHFILELAISVSNY